MGEQRTGEGGLLFWQGLCAKASWLQGSVCVAKGAGCGLLQAHGRGDLHSWKPWRTASLAIASARGLGGPTTLGRASGTNAAVIRKIWQRTGWFRGISERRGGSSRRNAFGLVYKCVSQSAPYYHRWLASRT